MEIWKSVEWVLPIRSDKLTFIMEGFTALAYPLSLFILLSLGYWLWRKETFRRLIILLILTLVINFTIKEFVKDPRPPEAYQLVKVQGYGFPSGHAQIAMVMWIGLALEINRPWAWAICSLVTLGMSFSRIYLGVHDLDDVCFGLLFGALTLALFYHYRERFDLWRQRLSLPVQLSLLYASTILWLGIYPGQMQVATAYLCGLILVQGTGLILEEKYIDFTPPQFLSRKIVIGTIGVLGLILIRLGNSIWGPFLLACGLSLWQTIIVPIIIDKSTKSVLP